MLNKRRLLAMILGTSLLMTQMIPVSGAQLSEEIMSYEELTQDKETVDALSEEAEVDGEKSEEILDRKDPVDDDWTFDCFGTSTNPSNAAFSGSVSSGSVSLKAINNNGKFIRGDIFNGLTVYYTSVPADKNFTLKAKVHIDNWFFQNAQSAAGLAAFDRVPEPGTRAKKDYVTNGYYAAATGSGLYYADPETGDITNNTAANKIEMYYGLSARSFTGVNPGNVVQFEDGADKESRAAAVAQFVSFSNDTLETSCAKLDPGKYNIIGNHADRLTSFSEPISFNGIPESQGTTTVKELTDFDLRIQRNNTGYFITYTGEDGRTVKYYDRDALNSLDDDYIYPGFFVARNASATFSDIELTVTDPANDPPAEKPEIQYVDLDGGFWSSGLSASEDYEARFSVNWDCDVTMTQGGKVIYEGKTKDGELLVVNTKLDFGGNVINVELTPDQSYHPNGDELIKLKKYDKVALQMVVNRVLYGEEGSYLYVTPDGKNEGTGTRKDPLSLETALKYVRKGQAIVLAPGVYQNKSEYTVLSGIDGTSEEPIYMFTDPERTDKEKRAVIKGSVASDGFILNANYWRICDIDIADSYRGLVNRGGNNVFSSLRLYNNAAYGIQFTGSPYKLVNNTILNCDMYDNEQGGMSLRFVGEGNVVEGCRVYYNGGVGIKVAFNAGEVPPKAVTIKNCATYYNGWVHKNGKLVIPSTLNGDGGATGIGVGGGSESKDYLHVIENCYSFYNRNSGFTSAVSNAAELKNSISYDNGWQNIAFNRNSSSAESEYAPHAYKLSNVVSIKDDDIPEIVTRDCGTYSFSEMDYIYGCDETKDAYRWMVPQRRSENSEGTVFTTANFKSVTFKENSFYRNADGSIAKDDFLSFADDISTKAPGVSSFTFTSRPSEDTAAILAKLIETSGLKRGQEIAAAVNNGKIMVIFDQDTAAEIFAIINVARGNAKGTKQAPEIVDVPQAVGDTTLIEESYVKGKVKTRAIDITEPGGTYEITLNSGVKYTLDDFNPDGFKDIKIESDKGKVAKVSKKGVLSLKSLKVEGYEVILTYMSLKDPTKQNTVKIKVKDLKAEKGKKIDPSSVSVNVIPAAVGGNDSNILSAKWSIKKTELKPGEWVDVPKGKNGVLAKAYLAPDNSHVSLSIPEDGAKNKGNIKVVAEVNGKKINTKVAVKNK